MLSEMADRSPMSFPPARPGRLGPALRRGGFPFGALGVSAGLHGVGLVTLVVLMIWGGSQTPRVQEVNLVATVAPPGRPEGTRTTEPLPPRPTPLPETARATPPEPLPKPPRQR